MQPDFDSRGVTRPLSAFLRLAMLGCPAAGPRTACSGHSLNPRRSRVIPGNEPAVKVRRSRTTAWQQPILRRFGVIHVAGAPISGFTRGDLKPTGISGQWALAA